jgi:hypothetical protein
MKPPTRYLPKVKISQSQHRPAQALRVPGDFKTPRSQNNQHKKVVKVVSPMHRLPLPPQEIFPVLILLEAESTPEP